MASSVDAKLLKLTKFPPEFNRKVDMTKVNIEVMKKWIASRISEILGNEDDVVIELCFGHLEGPRYPDIKSLQIQLTGFLDKDTSKFCQKLWSLCLSGQENPQGVPKELLEAKKLELIQEKLDAEKAAEAARRQKEQDQVRERDLDNVRRRERFDRGRGRGRGFDRRSPLPRDQGRHPDRLRESQSRRDFDSYVPHGPRRGRQSSSPRRNWNEPRHRSRERRRSPPGRSVSPQRRNRGGPRRPSPNYGDRARSRSIHSRNSSRSPFPKGNSSPSRSRSPVRSRRHSDRSYRDRDARPFGRSPDRHRNRDRSNDRDHARRRRSPSGSPSNTPQKDHDAKRPRSVNRDENQSRKQRSPPVDSAPEEKRRKTADGHPDSSSPPKTHEN